MSYNSIRIERDRNKFTVRATDPAIEKANRERKDDAPWQESSVEYSFDTKEQVIAFITSAMDIALPTDEYTSAFDKLAKEALKS